MGRRCTICHHPQHEAIDRALVDNEDGYRGVAKRFGISEQALYRHKQNHLPALLAKGLEAESTEARASEASAHAREIARHKEALDAGKVRQAIDVVQQLKAINAACLDILKKARTTDNPSMQLRAVDRIHRQIGLQAQLLGLLQDSKLQVAVGAGAQVVVMIPDNSRNDASPHRVETAVLDLVVPPAYLTGEDGDGS